MECEKIERPYMNANVLNLHFLSFFIFRKRLLGNHINEEYSRMYNFDGLTN